MQCKWVFVWQLIVEIDYLLPKICAVYYFQCEAIYGPFYYTGLTVLSSSEKETDT